MRRRHGQHVARLQSFQGLMFRLQAVRNLLPAQPDEAITVLDTALVRGEDAIDQARNAVDGLRASEKVEPNLESGLTAIAAATALLCKIDEPPSWEVTTRGRVREIPRTVLYELYQVAQEALSNAFRHARARRITVEVRYSADALRISVTDDGVGFDEAPLQSERGRRHWGLLGMSERVERLGGETLLRSRPRHGTTVSVSIPAGVAYGEWSLVDRIARRLGRGTGARSHGRG
jgi:signal transduction histidine kinase